MQSLLYLAKIFMKLPSTHGAPGLELRENKRGREERV
jgi:hypothetical protein